METGELQVTLIKLTNSPFLSEFLIRKAHLPPIFHTFGRLHGPWYRVEVL